MEGAIENNSVPSCERIFVMLQAEEREKRKAALKELRRSFEVERAETSKFWDTLNRPLSRLLDDPAEICRDQAIEIIKLFLTALPPEDKHILYVIPILSRRLGSQEHIESSEEVRLKCVSLLRILLPRYKEYLSAYVDDLIKILARTVADNYPLVKRESCTCISEFAKILSRRFYSQSEDLVKPILNNLTHQHYKVRIASVEAIGDVIEYGNSKSMDEVVATLAKRLFDQNGLVRAAVFKVAGRWLVKLKDRYSWWHKILPLLLTGLHDEIEEIRTESAILWDAAGKLYIEENQEDPKFKDKMDFLTNDPPRYPPGEFCAQQYLEYQVISTYYRRTCEPVRRPNLGCRAITQQNLGKLVGGISLELEDWMPDIRVRSAQLLCVLILNAEENVPQHIEKLLPAMYRACNDEDTRVVENVQKAAEYLGYFVHPEIYCHLVLPTLEEAPTAGHLRVFSAILSGSERTTLTPLLGRIGKLLSQAHFCQCKKSPYQLEILSCCCSLFTVCGENCRIVSEDLFRVIFTVLSMTTQETIKKEAERLLQVLADVNSLESIENIYELYVGSLISSFRDYKRWTVYAPNSQIFCACLIQAPRSAASNIDVVLSILEETMGDGSDPELRLKHSVLLTEYFARNRESVKETVELRTFLGRFLEKCILPGLVWSAGRAAEAIRTAAVSCLCAFLEVYSYDSLNEGGETSGCVTRYVPFGVENFILTYEKVVSVLLSLVDDNASKARLYSLRAIYLVISIARNLNCLTEEHICKIYPVVLKRLDDGCDDVRYASLECLTEIWNSVPKDYDLEFNRGHVEALYTTVMIHLDDPEIKFQNATLGTRRTRFNIDSDDDDVSRFVLDALKQLAKLHPTLLYQKLLNARVYFRNQSLIDTLLSYCQCLLRNTEK